MQNERKRIPCRKHDWRKVGASYSKETGLQTTKKRCINCGLEKEVN